MANIDYVSLPVSRLNGGVKVNLRKNSPTQKLEYAWSQEDNDWREYALRMGYGRMELNDSPQSNYGVGGFRPLYRV